MTIDRDDAPRPARRHRGRLLLLALLSAATWFGWFGWDTTYQVDASGNTSGPYETWQGLGAVLTIVSLVVVGTALRLGTALVALATAAGLTAGFVITSAPQDSSGLWGAGALFLAVGVFLGAAVVSYVTAWWLRHRTP
ncbi:hypothetical protein [Sanguibacter antarcticus]|uniref:Uncharacterized protein n=1 Tax=Sanguibacter antarcticus TaxID=372484 RepID=A0A2A9E8Y1_9MICO|nr:hypothetical protein [Sanguibacter antarcticus]PFG34620.1 hypothetical protein ATL42_2537 [Sanguibacter antarcticus]